MKILIAGGAGYIGSVLVPKLLERGYEVDVVDLLWFGNHLPPQVKRIHHDVMQLDEQMVSEYEQILFLAGLSNDPMAEYAPAKNFVYNAAAPAYLAYLAKKAGVKRYIYASSCSVYGYTVNELYDETAPAISNYPYGISKLQGETACLQLQDQNFSVIALRKGTVCGYSPRMRLDLVVNTMFKTALTQGMIIVNNPSIWRPVLAIQDAVSAYIRAIEANYDITGIFNVTSGNYTIGEIADYVQDAMLDNKGLNVKIQIKHLQDLRNYKVNIEKARNVLSFKPKYGIEGIIKDLFEHADQFSDFDNPSYYNIEVFKSQKTS
ncbi:NAD-dependent epimerase/dehydratase family protein [candidate division KSB3 bacterium]|uniref:NAD-dependent epimerase/dehydratase family protein n=1 Tax=candidate division KSB3 bacterium TaxID=2044937 RepID=A0A9D5JXY3_9BACT|nr:NAD-dependent epimerase/dehydratase family protein [candidate division KSB3 bacterium]MBD3326170.1 NAD-dependent epimerase/dehydratase family protein [candidate division KSB3 bacterium]